MPTTHDPFAPHDGGDTAPQESVLDGSVDDVMAYVEENPHHAAALLAGERAGGQRKTLIPQLEAAAAEYEAS